MSSTTYKNCIVAIDHRKRLNFIEHKGDTKEKYSSLLDEMVHTVEEKPKEGPSVEEILEEILDYDEVLNEPGIYKCDIVILSWQDNTPDSCDWNLDYELHNMIKIEL